MTNNPPSSAPPAQNPKSQPKTPLTKEEQRKKWMRFASSFAILGSASCVAIAGLGFWFFSKDLPRIITVADYQPRGVTKVIAENEQGDEVLVGEFFREKRFLVPYDYIPERVIQAFISAEDDSFFEHEGISPVAIMRAAIANLQAGHVVQGGSTITQQVAKSLFLTPARNIIRKIKEAILANRIEENLTKEQILYLYLNQIYLGHGAYGIQSAAKQYYNKDVNELTLAEIALLAGLPRAPSSYSPFRNASRAKERQRYVLRRMLENGFITDNEMISAIAQPLKVYPLKDVNKEHAAYLVEHVRRDLVEKYGENKVYDEGMTVKIPSRTDIFKKSRESMVKGLRLVDKKRGYRGPRRQLQTEEEIETFLAESRRKLIASKIPYRVFLPDGRLSVVDALDDAGVAQETDLLEEGKVFEALVSKVDNLRKMAQVAIGEIELDMPLETMKWALPYTGDTIRGNVELKKPSQAVSPGDVVLVKIVKRPRDEEKEKLRRKKRLQGEEVEEPFPLVAALEQDPEIQGALFSMEVETGYVLAMEGGYDFEKSEFNRAVQAQRQPGSSFKPVIFAAAVEKGFTPSSIMQDSPIVFKDEEIGKWKPTNISQQFYGDTPFRLAFILSRNIPTIKLVQQLGVPNVIEFAQRLGMTAEFNQDLSISLGSAATSLMEMTQVYSIFPRYGKRVDPIFIKKVIDRDGLVLEESEPQNFAGILPPPNYKPPVTSEQFEEEAKKLAELQKLQEGQNTDGTLQNEAAAQQTQPEENKVSDEVDLYQAATENQMKVDIPKFPTDDYPNQVLDPRVAYIMTHLMNDVVQYGTGRRAKGLGSYIGGKTGTTNEYKDAWFVGFSAKVSTGVWVGFDDHQSLGRGATGSGAALPIWMEYMRLANSPYTDLPFNVPPGVTLTFTDSSTGKLVDESAPMARLSAFLEGTEPTERIDASSAPNPDSVGEFLKEDF